MKWNNEDGMDAPFKDGPSKSYNAPTPDAAVIVSGVELSLGTGRARVHILKQVSLEIGAGEAVGLIGPSGSGKSTLLMVMAGLERPDAGIVKIAGQDLGALSEDELARFRGRNVGIVFQSFHLIPTMTALENVVVPLELAGRAREGLAQCTADVSCPDNRDLRHGPYRP